MDDFLSILLVVIIYLVAALSSDKKKKARQAKKAKQNHSRTERMNTSRSSQTQRGFAAAFGQAQAAPKQEEKKDIFPRKPKCEENRIHLHEVSQEAFLAAGEGADPCHAGGVEMDASLEEESPIYAQRSEESTQLAQDVLRGVIMAEILTRPRDRAAMNRRSGMYHGQ